MLDFISKDVREYMEQNNLKFTDFEKAALIYHAGFPVLKRRELLKKLAVETQDKALMGQIRERFAYGREEWKAFRKKTDGYCFIVELQGGDGKSNEYACFDTAENAYALARALEQKFEMKKYIIESYLLEGRDAEKLVSRAEPVAVATFDKDGKILCFWSDEVKMPKEEVEKYDDPTRFENAFIAVPNPFERGDIVRSTMNHAKHGVIETSQQEWKEYLERVKSWGRESLDFYESGITVEFLQEDGHLMHDHVSPAFLEKYEPKKDDEDYDVLTGASCVLLGQCELDIFLHYLKKYQESRES